MKSLTVCAFLSLVLAALAAGCAAPVQDEALDDGQASSDEAVASTEQGITPINPCDDTTMTQIMLKDCPGAAPNVTCTRECDVTRHWSILLNKCVVDTTTCGSWTCPPCQ
ncbi:MAG: hypothetical protein QM820_54110 [Minicystis sp.]